MWGQEVEKLDDKDILLQLYREECSFARHHDNLRSRAVSLIIAVAGGTLGLAGFDRELTDGDVPVGVFIVALGIFGVGFTLKSFERVHHHFQRADQYLNRLACIALNAQLVQARKEAHSVQNAKFYWLSKLPHLYQFWVGLSILTTLLGVVVVVFSLSIQKLTAPKVCGPGTVSSMRILRS